MFRDTHSEAFIGRNILRDHGTYEDKGWSSHKV